MTDYKNEKTRPKDLCYCTKGWRCWECSDRGYCTQSPPGWDDGYDWENKRYVTRRIVSLKKHRDLMEELMMEICWFNSKIEKK